MSEYERELVEVRRLLRLVDLRLERLHLDITQAVPTQDDDTPPEIIDGWYAALRRGR